MADGAYGCLGCMFSAVALLAIVCSAIHFALADSQRAMAEGFIAVVAIPFAIYCLYVVFSARPPDDEPPQESPIS